MQTENLKLTPEMLLWKKNNIKECVMEFSCGGDSMNEYEFSFYDEKNKKLNNQDTKELNNFFEDEVFKEVEFYVNSDGHYMGEFGSVEITLNEDDEDEPFFEYCKSANAEFIENGSDEIEIEFNKKQIQVLQSKVLNLNGGEGESGNVNYKNDCVITDEEEQIIDHITRSIDDEAGNHYFEFEGNSECGDWYSWTTNFNDTMVIKNNKLKVEVTRSFTTIRESED